MTSCILHIFFSTSRPKPLTRPYVPSTPQVGRRSLAQNCWIILKKLLENATLEIWSTDHRLLRFGKALSKLLPEIQVRGLFCQRASWETVREF